MKPQRGSKPSIISTEVLGSLHSAVHRKSSRYMENGVGILQPTWTVCCDEIVRCVVSAGTE